MNVTSALTKAYENMSNWAICENEPNSNPKQTQFQTANLLIERAKSELLNFHLKNSLTGLCNSVKYWALYCERDFL